MKERERLEVIEKIKEIEEEKKLLEENKIILKDLSEHPVVKKYLSLKDDINMSEERLKRYQTLDQTINWKFSTAFRNSRKDVTPCNHDLWIYDGSYYLLIDPLCERDIEIKEYSENAVFKYPNDWKFLHNRYICLECGKKIETKDWKKFENSNSVLKIQNPQEDLGVQYYVDKYYRLLYENNIEEAQSLIVKEFNENKEKIKQKI